ncbi:hypothetical protein ACHAXS_011445 [Conticribra weissflogii]
MSTSSTHWDILSVWSKAGIGTNVVLELKQPLLPPKQQQQKHNKDQTSKKNKSMPRVAFDIGATPCFDDAIPSKFVFVSHGHVDHIGALFSHARAHSVAFGGTAPTYFVPAELLPQLERCRESMSLLDAAGYATENNENALETSSGHDKNDERGRTGTLMNMKLVPVKPGDEFPLHGIHSGSKTSFFIRAFRADHSNHPALGYLLCSRTSSSGLKAEYQHLDKESIRDLVKSGVNIQNDPVEHVEVAYTGDTCADGLIVSDPLIENSDAVDVSEDGVTMLKQMSDEYVRQIFRAQLILCELTFLDYEEKVCNREMAKDRGHLHINELDRIFSNYYATLDYLEAFDKSEVDSPITSDDTPPEIGRENTQSIVREDSFLQLLRPNGCISILDYLEWKNKRDSEVGGTN